MKTLKKLLLTALMLLLMISAAAAADEKGGQAMAPSPVVISMAKFPITVAGGDYDLLTIIQDFPAGVGVGTHKHGGHIVATVLSGEMTLREKGAERVVKIGESWTEHPGDIHAVMNAGTVTSRVAISVLIPKGADVTTMVK
jgi:quercetin dioxygenase-like cupin family protein